MIMTKEKDNLAEIIESGANITLSITAEDLMKVVNRAIEKSFEASRKANDGGYPKYVHGLQGIADLFGVSKVTAQKYKNTWLAGAVTQQGKVLLTDTEKAFNLFKTFEENNNQ